MKIFHLNCGTMNGFGLPKEEGTGDFFKRGRGVVHCLLIETSEGLVLIDTGWGLQDYSDPSPQVKFFMDFMRCSRNPNEAAIKLIETLGYNPMDVKHIFLTHLHLDHAGGLPDFPDAVVHVYDVELSAYLHPRNLMERFAYLPEYRLHQPRWQVHRFEGGQWLGVDSLPPVRVGETEFVMVPLTGHTRGHCAVAVRQGEKWLMHCGDAYGYFQQVNPVQPYLYPNGRLMEALVTIGFRMPRRHWKTIRVLRDTWGDCVMTCCSHDLHEFLSMNQADMAE